MPRANALAWATKHPAYLLLLLLALLVVSAEVLRRTQRYAQCWHVDAGLVEVVIRTDGDGQSPLDIRLMWWDSPKDPLDHVID